MLQVGPPMPHTELRLEAVPDMGCVLACSVCLHEDVLLHTVCVQCLPDKTLL